MLLRKHIEDKSIVWFKNSNQYVVLENATADILVDLKNGISADEIANKITIDAPKEEILQFINQISTELFIPLTSETKEVSETFDSQIPETSDFKISKFYNINEFVFKVDFKSDLEVYLVHPKFSHLEIDEVATYDFNYQVYTKNDYTSLNVDNEHIGTWHRKDIHYFQGKFSMLIVQHIHKKEEKDWLGVFHASGIGNEQKSLLILGDSGNGKSTSLAILQANGLTCYADDFVPVDAKKQHVYTFPSAISIKRNSLETLLPMYPELKNAAEFNFVTLNKIVRFLTPKTIVFNHNVPCNDFVFIKYQKDSDLNFSKISNIEAFEQLIPDSWLSKEAENVASFLDWFSTINCYQLTYSNNERMVATIKKLLDNDI